MTGIALTCLERLGRHVQLLFHDRGRTGRAGDDERDVAQMRRTQQETDRLASADALFLGYLSRAADRLAAAYHDDNGEASAEGNRTDQQEIVAHVVDEGRDHGAPGRASQTGACADEAE